MNSLETVIEKYFDLKKIGHAYLLKTNDEEKVFEIAKHILSIKDQKNLNIENLIDEAIYSDFKMIEPDGQWIKKEQILDLQNEFKVRSIYNNRRIYIIKNAENLNKSSGNTLLKFLEEPSEDIVALLITKNPNKVLDTIVSRCQFISLDSNDEQVPTDYTEAAEICNIIDKDRYIAEITLFKKFEEYEDKAKFKQLLQEMGDIYEFSLLQQFGIESSKNIDIDKISKNNTISTIKRKLDAIIFGIDMLDYNVNMRLLVDKLVISMFGVD